MPLLLTLVWLLVYPSRPSSHVVKVPQTLGAKVVNILWVSCWYTISVKPHDTAEGEARETNQLLRTHVKEWCSQPRNPGGAPQPIRRPLPLPHSPLCIPH